MGRKTKQNSITSPELLKQVNPENTQLLNEFLDYLRSIKRSNGTIEQYRSDINIAFVWNLQNNNNKFFVDWTKRNVVAYQNWLLNNNENSPARVRRLKAALSSMSNFIEAILDEDYPNFRNIINKIENPASHPVREKTVWEQEELEKLLDLLMEQKSFEKACFVALGMYGGRRKSEICRFKVSDFSNDKLVCGGALYKSAPILTKGNKYLECYTLAKRFKPYLDAWMDWRNEHNIQSEWLFPDQTDPTQQRNIESLNSWAVSLSALTGRDFYFHSLRHYFVSALSRAGIPDNVVVQIIGWSSSEMFNIYNDNSKDSQIGMYFANGDIVIPDKKGFADL